MGTNNIVSILVTSALSFFHFGQLFTPLTPTSAPLPSEQKTFSIVVLPDTQYYSLSYPDIFRLQTNWIVQNKERLNIVFVSQLGDIVETWNGEEQWRAADRAMEVLDGKVLYGIAPGNHDLSPVGKSPFFERYFPGERLAQSPQLTPLIPGLDEAALGYGSYGTKNSYHLFGVAGQKFIAFNLEFCPTDKALDWTDTVLSHYPDRQAIISTHSFITSTGNRASGAAYCTDYAHEGTNTAQDMWDRLIVKSQHNNILLFLSGHDIWSAAGAARRTDIVRGRPIHQLLSDYQMFDQGGGGYLRLMQFDYNKHQINVKTYSPLTDTEIRSPENNFTLSLPSTD